MMYPSEFVRYSRELLLRLRPSSVRQLTSSLRIACNTECLVEPLRRFRGCRAGQHVQLRHTPFTADVNTNAMSVLIGNRPSLRQRKSQQPEAHKVPQSSALIRVVSCVPQTPVTAALINAQSVGNKSASICDRVATDKPSIYAIVETWHDSSDCPTLVCVPPGYGCLEKARPRAGEHANSTATNHGGV